MAKAPTDIRALARSHTAAAINTLAGIMRQKAAAPAARVAASVALLDRGWGKASQTMEIIARSTQQLTDDELADIATASGEGTDKTPVDQTQLH
jgi:hypothetical protein